MRFVQFLNRHHLALSVGGDDELAVEDVEILHKGAQLRQVVQHVDGRGVCLQGHGILLAFLQIAIDATVLSVLAHAGDIVEAARSIAQAESAHAKLLRRAINGRAVQIGT